MANVLFKKGLLKNLPAEKVAGTIYVTTDERAMYLDVDASTRIRLGDFNEIPNLNALPDVSHTGGSPNPTGLYYSVAENVLARYDSEHKKWAQINPDNWFEIQSFAQNLSSATDNNITTVTVNTTLTQMNEAGNQAGSGAASQWSNNLKFKDDGSVVTITQEGTDTIKISAKDEKVTSADNHYTYNENRDGPAVAATSITDTNTGNTFITGVSIDKAGHVVGVKSREAVIDLVTNPTLGTSATEKDTGSDANSAANIDFSISHGGTNPGAHLKVEGAGATTVSTSNNGQTLKISSTDQTVTYGHHYDPSTHESSSAKISIDSGKVLSEIKRDDSGHVIGVTARDENKLSAVSMTSSGSENDVTLTTQVSDALGSPLGTIKITGSGDAKVTAAADNKSINIETHDTKVTSADNHYKAKKASDGTTDIVAGTYNAVDSVSSKDNEDITAAKAKTPVVTGVTIDAAGHVTGITATKIADTHNKLTGTGTASPALEHGNGWKFELTDDDGNLNVTAFDPTIKYGKDSQQTVHGVDGSFTLDTYTTGEVDAKITTAIQATGAMVLKGELNSTQSLPTTNVAAGDTYIVTENGITVAGNVCEVGDLLVAKADMATGSTDANWYYVPSGNDRHIVIGTNNDVAKTVGAVLVDGNQTANVKYGSINFNSDASASDSLIKAEKFVDAASGDLGAQDVRFVFSMEWGSF